MDTSRVDGVKTPISHVTGIHFHEVSSFPSSPMSTSSSSLSSSPRSRNALTWPGTHSRFFQHNTEAPFSRPGTFSHEGASRRAPRCFSKRFVAWALPPELNAALAILPCSFDFSSLWLRLRFFGGGLVTGTLRTTWGDAAAFCLAVRSWMASSIWAAACLDSTLTLNRSFAPCLVVPPPLTSEPRQRHIVSSWASKRLTNRNVSVVDA
mmetsp:Transcript_7271/g.22687  ORF Transcript_7271/g.22687 Transcript_7271/m.22687 type:complete len:208 (+) Transcript_7271:199-822(+)